jgi:hypothetical protein
MLKTRTMPVTNFEVKIDAQLKGHNRIAAQGIIDSVVAAGQRLGMDVSVTSIQEMGPTPRLVLVGYNRLLKVIMEGESRESVHPI